MAPGPGLKGEDQTVVPAVQGEGEVWQQAGLILYEQRGHAHQVLRTTGHMRKCKQTTIMLQTEVSNRGSLKEFTPVVKVKRGYALNVNNLTTTRGSSHMTSLCNKYGGTRREQNLREHV